MTVDHILHRRSMAWEESSTNIFHKGKKFKLKLKLEAISYGRIHNNRAAAKKFNIYEKIISKWTKKQEELSLTRTKTVRESKKGLGGGGRKLIDRDL